MGVSGQPPPPPPPLFTAGKDPRYPLYRRLGGPQPVWTQRLEEKSFVSVGDRTPVVQRRRGWGSIAPAYSWRRHYMRWVVGVTLYPRGKDPRYPVEELALQGRWQLQAKTGCKVVYPFAARNLSKCLRNTSLPVRKHTASQLQISALMSFSNFHFAEILMKLMD
jgi:hypothetical protein